jgi:CDP-diacylglycerol--serine O-phosphatidyltransferase
LAASDGRNTHNSTKRPRHLPVAQFVHHGRHFAGFYAIVAPIGRRYSEAALAVFIAGILDGRMAAWRG